MGEKQLPTIEEVWSKATHYAIEERSLQNFMSDDEITLAKAYFLDGYGQAIKDLICPDFDIIYFKRK